MAIWIIEALIDSALDENGVLNDVFDWVSDEFAAYGDTTIRAIEGEPTLLQAHGPVDLDWIQSNSQDGTRLVSTRNDGGQSPLAMASDDANLRRSLGSALFTLSRVDLEAAISSTDAASEIMSVLSINETETVRLVRAFKALLNNYDAFETVLHTQAPSGQRNLEITDRRVTQPLDMEDFR
jgi:hypothetical protein